MPLSDEIVEKFNKVVFKRNTTVADLQEVFLACESEQIGELLSQNNYDCFGYAAFKGRAGMVQAMLDICPPEQRSAMNAAEHYSAFRQARRSQWGSARHVSEILLAYFPEDASAMIHASEQEIFYDAIGISPDHSYIEICDGMINVEDLNIITRAYIDLRALESLFRRTTVQQQQEYIQFGNYLAIRSAIQNGSAREFGILYHYASRQQRLAIARISGAAGFIDPENYSQTHHSRSRDTDARYQNNPNTSTNHRESSMRALTPAEEKRLSNILAHYKPIVSSRGGEEQVFKILVRRLQQRYLNQKATVQTGDGRTIELPLTWQEWQKLAPTLNSESASPHSLMR